ncbi:MAG: hypothetical protein ABIT09_01065, partial [Croceibacterium sp.]
MAIKVKHVALRDGIFQYHRRVPLDIVRDVAAFETYFHSSKLFRRSLNTSDASEILRGADRRRVEFDEKVTLARGGGCVAHRSMGHVRPQKLTAQLISEISEQQRLVTLKPWIDAYLNAEQSEEHREELERMSYEREGQAEDLKLLLTKQGMRSSDPRVESPIDTAGRLVLELNLDAPLGSPQRSMLALAIRRGRVKGQRDIDCVLNGELPSATEAPISGLGSAVHGATLRDAVDRYVADRSLAPKTVRDVQASLILFERAVGNKRLADLTRTDFRRFIEDLATTQIGGRSVGSVVRMIAPATVKKRLTFLGSAIKHAIEKDMHEGGNPASNFDISAWVKAPDKSVMASKRPFAVEELNLVFLHPWFTGCATATNIHAAGSHRLAGMHYWAPVLAMFSGCRVSELGGLKLNEVQLDGPHPHLHIRDNEFRPTKKGYARFVPVVDSLRALGFSEYVARIKALGGERLFPDWEPARRTGNFDKDDAA